MRVLEINSVCGIRSTGRIVGELADAFIKDGHQCRIAYGREQAASAYEKISHRIGTETDVRLNALAARLFDDEGFNAVAETRRLLQWAERYDPDLVWLHNLHGYYINVEMLFDWLKRRPQTIVRWTLHDCWAFTGHCAHFSYVHCDQWKTECQNCCQRGEYPKSWLADNCAKNFQRKRQAFCGVKNMTLITPSKWLANLVGKSFLQEYPVEVIPNRIDTTVFKPTESNFRASYQLEHKKIILGVASAWSEKKGLTDFIKLAEMLPSFCIVVLVGLTKEQIKKMPREILCIERTNSTQELAGIYTAADVFVNLTYEDTYPTVNLEAQACGTPCLTYRTGGSVETVSQDCVAEQGNLQEIMKKIMQITTKEYI